MSWVYLTQPRELETRTTVYRKQDIIYNLKMKTSRELLADVEKRFGLYAFSLRYSLQSYYIYIYIYIRG